MSIKCTLGFHDWQDCTCQRCGKDRHDWQGCVCTTCGTNRHSWQGCTCQECGKDRHAWDGCVCTICGKDNHTWDGCVCLKCGKTRDEGHDWEGCKCAKCGKTRDEQHDWSKDREKCAICGKKSNSSANANLVRAAEKGILHGVQRALNDGANVNIIHEVRIISNRSSLFVKVAAHSTALIRASENGYTEIVRLLLDKGADLNVMDTEYGKTALYVASQNGHMEVVKLLLDKGPDLNVITTEGATALYVASMNGHMEIVKLLLDKGADVDVKDVQGATALTIALQKNHAEIVKLIKLRNSAPQASASSSEHALHEAATEAPIRIDKSAPEQCVDLSATKDKPVHPASQIPADQSKAEHSDALVNESNVEDQLSVRIRSHIAALKDRDWWVRKAAVYTLAEIGLPAVESLIATLNDTNSGYTARIEAASILGKIGDNRAVPSLIAALTARMEVVVKASADALMQIRDERAVEALAAVKMRGIQISHRNVYNVYKMMDGDAPVLVDPACVERVVIAFNDDVTGTMKKGAISTALIDRVLLQYQPQFWNAVLSFESNLPATAVTFSTWDAHPPAVLERLEKIIDLSQLTVVLFKIEIPENQIAFRERSEEFNRIRRSDTPIQIQGLAGFCYRDQQPRFVLALRDSVVAYSHQLGEPTLNTGLAKVTEKQLLDAAAEGDYNQVSTLLESGVDVNAGSKEGTTSLMYAAMGGHSGAIETVHTLLRHGADVNARNATGFSALMLTASEGHSAATEIVHALLRSGADVNAATEDGTTALAIAAMRGHGAIIEVLVRNGADVNIRTQSGMTALDIAKSKGHTVAVQALQGLSGIHLAAGVENKEGEKGLHTSAGLRVSSGGSSSNEPNIELSQSDPECIQSLINTLKDKNSGYKARKEAAISLGKIGDIIAVPSLIAVLKDSRMEVVRQAAVEALGRIGDGSAVEPLNQALKDSHAIVRQAAVIALRKLNLADFSPPSKSSDGNDRPSIPQTCSDNPITQQQQGVVIQPTVIDDELRTTYSDVPTEESSFEVSAPEDIDSLMVALGDKDVKVRELTVNALVRIGVSAIERLTAALQDENYEVRYRAAETLGKIGDYRAIEPLLAASNGKDLYVLEAVTRAIWQISGKTRDTEKLHSNLEGLIKALYHERSTVGNVAIEVLRRIGVPAIERLITSLKDENYVVRYRAAKTLGEIGDSRAIEPLISALKDSEKEVRHNAVVALGGMGVPIVEPFIAALTDQYYVVRLRAAETLGKIRDVRAVESLLIALGDSEKAVQRAAVIALGAIGDSSAELSLLGVLRKHKDPLIREAAANALEEIRGAQSSGNPPSEATDAAEPTLPAWTERCFDSPPADNDVFIGHFKDCLPALFNSASGRSSDQVMMLVALEQEKWRALLALLYKQSNRLFLSPESYAQGKVRLESNGYCDVYVAPEVDGRTLKVGIYALERDFLFSQLCWVKDLPPPFLNMVKEEKKAGHFSIVVFNSNGMCVRHLPLLNSKQAVPTSAIQALSKVNAGQKAKSKPEETALVLAARKGDSNMVKALIAAGADVNFRDKEGTALMYVTADCDTDSVKAMVAAGADVNAENNSWGTPLQMCLRDNGKVDSDCNVDSSMVLISASANVNAKDKYGGTALMTAAGNCGFKFYARIDAYNAAFEALIAAGADVNAKNDSGKTALMYAAGKRKGLYQVNLLIAAGADVNARDNEGKNVLMYAAKSDLDIGEALKAAGANLSPSEAAMLLNQPPEKQEWRSDIPRVSTPASTLKTRLSAGMSIEEVHKMLGEPHGKNRYTLIGCDYHEVWITNDGSLRVFYDPSRSVVKWAVE